MKLMLSISQGFAVDLLCLLTAWHLQIASREGACPSLSVCCLVISSLPEPDIGDAAHCPSHPLLACMSDSFDTP